MLGLGFLVHLLPKQVSSGGVGPFFVSGFSLDASFHIRRTLSFPLKHSLSGCAVFWRLLTEVAYKGLGLAFDFKTFLVSELLETSRAKAVLLRGESQQSLVFFALVPQALLV